MTYYDRLRTEKKESLGRIVDTALHCQFGLESLELCIVVILLCRLRSCRDATWTGGLWYMRRHRFCADESFVEFFLLEFLEFVLEFVLRGGGEGE